MAISFVSAGSIASGSSNFSVPLPSGYASGDLLVICAGGDANLSSAAPVGWETPSSVAYANFFYKIATSSESAPTITPANKTKAVMLCYRGIGLRVNAVSSPNQANSVTSIASSSITTLIPNEYVVTIYGSGGSVNSSWTAPGSTTSRANSASTTTAAGLLVVDELKSTAGATSTRTASVSASNFLSVRSFSISETLSAGNFFLFF